MNVNSQLIKQLRQDRAWSQDELAIAAGLNLRTVQRVERQGTASLQSKKALAAALEVDVHDLDYEQKVMMKKFEYKTIEIDPKAGFLAGIKKAELPDFAEILSAEGEQGWQLVHILNPDLAQLLWTGRSGRFVALMQREYVQEVAYVEQLAS